MIHQLLNKGSVWWVDFDSPNQYGIKKPRLCVIISDSNINKTQPTVVVVPLSSSHRIHPPVATKVKYQNKDVIAICDQVIAIDKCRFISYISDISNTDMQRIEDSIKKFWQRSTKN